MLLALSLSFYRSYRSSDVKQQNAIALIAFPPNAPQGLRQAASHSATLTRSNFQNVKGKHPKVAIEHRKSGAY